MKARFFKSVAFAPFLGVALMACGGAPDANDTASSESAVTGPSIADLARNNLGKGACSTNSLGGHGFESSCYGNGGTPEYWCADFAKWVWAHAGVKDTGSLTAGVWTFYSYGAAHHTLHSSPHPGDAVVFVDSKGNFAHVAIVSWVYSNGTVNTISGDWGGVGTNETEFASTSHVDRNAPYAPTIGTVPWDMGLQVYAIVGPVL
jgi:hypothetical protein